MRILQIIDTLHLGGAQSLQLTLAEELTRRGIEMQLICLRPGGRLELDLEFQNMGVPVHFVDGRSLLDLARFKHLVQLIRSLKPDVIQTHLTYANILGTAAASWLKIPSVATLHSTSPDPGVVNQLRFLLEKLILRIFSAAVIAVGEQVKQAYSSGVPAKKIRVVPNAVSPAIHLSPDERSARRKELCAWPEGKILVTVGRLSAEKGLPEMISAFAQIHAAKPDTTLWIIGSGEQRELLAHQIETLGLANSARLLGLRKDVPQLLASADLYLSASHWEGLPVAVLEAMSAGLPVVTTAVGDLPQLIDTSRGRLVPPKDVPALAEATLHMLESGDLASMGAQSKRYVEQNHHPRVWADRLMDVYSSAIQKTSAQRRRWKAGVVKR